MVPTISSGSKVIRAASSNAPNVSSQRFFFPQENDAPWDKGHGKLVHRRIKTLELSPEEIGLCGCWRIAAVERVTIDLTKPSAQQLPVTEIAYYVGSRTKDELPDADMLDAIVGHWDAIENGTHRVRDVSMGEDTCRVADSKAVRNTVTLRNLTNGLYNLLLFKKKIQSPSLPSWRRSMTNSQALKHILR